MRRNDRNAELLAMLFGQQLVAPRFGRRLKNVRRGIRRVLQSFIGPKHPDQRLSPVIIRSHIFIIDRPVNAPSIPGLWLEIIRPHAKSYAPPMVRPAPKHPRPPPSEFRPRRGRIWLARHSPAAIHRRVKKTERLVRRRRPA